jgi:hypothetical protein
MPGKKKTKKKVVKRQRPKMVSLDRVLQILDTHLMGGVHFGVKSGIVDDLLGRKREMRKPPRFC